MPTEKKIDKQENAASATTDSADSNKKFVLCITDAFTKYALVTAIANKEAETVADAIYRDWFAKFGIPAQVHTEGSKNLTSASPVQGPSGSIR